MVVAPAGARPPTVELQMFQNAIVMLALDDRDAAVLRLITDHHARFGLEALIVVHVVPRSAVPEELSAGLSVGRVERPPALDAAAEALRAALGPGVSVRSEFGHGDPVEVLEEIVQGSGVDLLVIGRADRTGAGPAWGPSGRKLMRAVTCSVLVVPAGAAWSGARATVGLDFSTCASHALKAAVKVAPSVDAVYQYTLDSASGGQVTEAEFQEKLSENARRHFEQVVLPSLGGAPAPSFALRLADDAASALLASPTDALLVVGSRGLSRIATVLLGSTAERVAGLTDGPLLVVRRKGEVIGLLEGLFHR